MTAYLLHQGGVQRAPGAAQQQEAGDVGEAAVLHPDLVQIACNADGHYAYNSHGEHQKQSKGVTQAVLAKDRAAAAQIDCGQREAPVPRILIGQNQGLPPRLLGQNDVAIQLGPHLFIAPEGGIVIGVERLLPQVHPQPVDRPPCGQHQARVRRIQAVVIEGQGFPAVQRDGTRYLDLHPTAGLQAVPALRELPYTLQRGPYPLSGTLAQREPHCQQDGQHQHGLPAPLSPSCRFAHLFSVCRQWRVGPFNGHFYFISISLLKSIVTFCAF